jgi:hypothetical protein
MHPCCAIPRARHIEYFHDHARIEKMLFDGFIGRADGVMYPDKSQPGLGLKFKRADAQQYEI